MKSIYPGVLVLLLASELALVFSGCERLNPTPQHEEESISGKPAEFTVDYFASNPQRVKEAKMLQLNESVLRESKDPKSLMKMAQAFAASERAADHAILLKYLDDLSFLSRIDDEETYRGNERELRLAAVLQVLRDSPAPQANATKIALCSKPNYNAHGMRVDLLIELLASIRPAPPEAMAYWRQYSTPDSYRRHFVVNQLAKNGSYPAIGLFEELLRSSEYSSDHKISWIRDEVLEHRYELPMVEAAGRLVQVLPPEIAVPLAEVYFDYRPDEWYVACTPPKPQPLEDAGKDVHPKVRALGEYALEHLPLSDELQRKVKEGLAELD